MADQQKVDIKIPAGLTKDQREALATEILEHIRQRSESGVGVKKQGKGFSLYNFPGYSAGYKGSLDFKVAGKSSSVDLTLSGDMLAAMDALKIGKEVITVGFEAGTSENDRAEGNQIGSYGKPSGNPRKARRFLGLTADELSTLIAKVKENG